MISASLSQYTRSFGGKVFGEVLLFPGLDVRYPIALQSGLEVNLSGLQETAEAYFQRHDKDEAGHPVHPVGRFPLLEAAKQGFDNVRRHVVNFFVTAQQGSFRCKVANHHASESRKSLAASHEFLIDDCNTLYGRFPGEPGFLAEREYFAEVGHGLAEFIHQSPVLPDEGIHAALLGGERADGFHHILGPLNPVEDVHPTCKRTHVIGHHVINIRKGVMPGAPDSLGERDKLLVPPVDGFEIGDECMTYIHVPHDPGLGEPLYKIASVVGDGVSGSTSGLGRHTVHGRLDVLALMGGGHVDVCDFHIGAGKGPSRRLRRSLQCKQDLVFRNRDALVHDDGIGLPDRHVFVAPPVHVLTNLPHPVTHGGVRDFGKPQGREYEVDRLHGLGNGAEAASRICVHQCRHLDYFFCMPVSFDMSNAITSAARGSTPASTSFF